MAVQERILNEIKGRMLEDIVLQETQMANPKKEVFVLQFAIGEFDMVVFDPLEGNCQIFEIKHSTEAVKSQYRERRSRKIAPRLCRIYARMAFRTYRIARWQQCRMAHRPETFRQSRLHRGYRNTCLAFERIYYRTESQRTMCRPEGIRSRTSDR